TGAAQSARAAHFSASSSSLFLRVLLREVVWGSRTDRARKAVTPVQSRAASSFLRFGYAVLRWSDACAPDLVRAREPRPKHGGQHEQGTSGQTLEGRTGQARRRATSRALRATHRVPGHHGALPELQPRERDADRHPAPGCDLRRGLSCLEETRPLREE